MLAGSSRKKSVFVELDDCQAFLVNVILKLFQCFLPECFLTLLSVLSSVYTQILNVGLDSFHQYIHYVLNASSTQGEVLTFPVLLRVCFVVRLHINEATPHVLN